MKAKKLTDKQQKMLIADRANGATFRELAEKYGVSPATAQRMSKIDCEEKAQIVTQQKAYNTKNVLEYIETLNETVCNLVDVCLEELGDKNRISKASLKDIALVLCMLIDKFSRTSETRKEDTSGGIIEIPCTKVENEED